MQLERHAAIGDARRLRAAEHFLQPHRQYRRRFAVVDADARTGGHRPVGRRLLIQRLGQRPGQQPGEYGRQIQIGKMRQPRDLAEPGRQPLLQAVQQGLIGYIGPGGLAALLKIQITQQQDTRLPLAQRRRPGQQVQALLAYHRAECAIALFRFDVPERLAAVHQCPHPPLLLGHQGFAAPIPFQRLFLMQQLRQVFRQPGGIQSRGQEDPRIALAGVPAEAGNHQPLLLLQTVDLREGR